MSRSLGRRARPARPLAFAFALALSLVGVAGCIGDGDDIDPSGVSDLFGSAIAPPGSPLYDRTDDFSHVLEAGPYGILDGVITKVASADGTELSSGVFLPDIPGCDWAASELPAECTLPVVMDVGPYFSPTQDTAEDVPAERLGRFLIENLVPHGYAVVQASVRGTGLSDGCNDFLGPKEQEDVDSFVTYYGEQPWSNGNVGIIGRSYDGTTPWEAATFGNPHLKTIVPISGLSNVADMYYHNGSSEARAPILGTIYSSFALDDGRSPDQMLAVVCPETLMHPAFGTLGYANGGGTTPAGEVEYWAQRNYQPRVLENYEGSVWIIHGLQDWNVDPVMAFPFANELVAAGLDVKVWAGQWQHNYPDRPGEHDHLRWDWAQTVQAWFDRYLKGIDVDTGPAFESEDNYGNWRALDAWPPREISWSTFYLSPGHALTAEPGESGEFVIADPHGADLLPCVVNEGNPVVPDNGLCLTLSSEPVAADVHVGGLPRLHVTVTPAGNGGQLYAELFEDTGGELVKFGHAQMDLRYHAGGTEPQAVTPGMPITAMMEFFPLDAMVHEGSRVVLVLRQQSLSEPLPAVQQTPVIVSLGEGSTLSLPIGDAGDVHYVSEGVDPQSTW